MDGQTKEIIVHPMTDLQKSIDVFTEPLSMYLEDIGLPTRDVLYPIEKRKQVIRALEDALSGSNEE